LTRSANEFRKLTQLLGKLVRHIDEGGQLGLD
jgi:hypothetical protein